MVTPWRFFGWGMYAQPHPYLGRFLVIERPSSGTPILEVVDDRLVLSNLVASQAPIFRSRVRALLSFPSQKNAEFLVERFSPQLRRSGLVVHVVTKRYDVSHQRLYHQRQSFRIGPG